MGAQSDIEWTDSTWTPLRARKIGGMVGDRAWRNNLPGGKGGWHCEHVSEGCRNCYAESMNRRLGTGLDFKPGHHGDIEIFLDEKMLLAPLKWKKPRRIFVNSMTDLFADFVRDEWIDRMFAVMALAPQHRFQVLTKRAKRMREYLTKPWGKWAAPRDRVDATMQIIGQEIDKHDFEFPLWPLPNVWLGVSAEDQANADARIDHLMMTEATVNFVSLEPLLGPIDLSKWVKALDWVIVGGESGPHARPMHPDWAKSLRDQCAAAGVPFFFKQWGEYRYQQFGEDDPPRRVGKKRAGRLLDGELHDGMPA